ncbi:hypothetical protein ACFQ1S_21870, partial [Kibdelosporangium lantanae]
MRSDTPDEAGTVADLGEFSLIQRLTAGRVRRGLQQVVLPLREEDLGAHVLDERLVLGVHALGREQGR